VSLVRNAFNEKGQAELVQLTESAVANRNMFANLMEACKSCTIGDITESLFEVGGQYRRNM
jgi:methylmalonyl-CoA mutase